MAVTPWDRAYWDRAVLVGPGKRIVISKTNLSEITPEAAGIKESPPEHEGAFIGSSSG
jgi:hypothetical protein